VERNKNLPTIFLSPREYPTGTITTPHEALNLFTVHAPSLVAVSEAITIFEVDPMFVEQMQPLLFIV
jgi:hypothetical protein